MTTPLPSKLTPPIQRAQLRAYADASGDINPIHLDDAFAQRAGFPSVIVHGMLSLSMMAEFGKTALTDRPYTLTRLKGRFRKVAFPDQPLELGGEIRSREPEGTVVLGLWAKNPQGEIIADGEASLSPQ